MNGLSNYNRTCTLIACMLANNKRSSALRNKTQFQFNFSQTTLKALLITVSALLWCYRSQSSFSFLYFLIKLYFSVNLMKINKTAEYSLNNSVRSKIKGNKCMKLKQFIKLQRMKKKMNERKLQTFDLP